MFAAIASFILTIGLAQYVRLRVRDRRLAPGPRGHWFYGNMFQFPLEKPWLWYMKLHDQYGTLGNLARERSVAQLTLVIQ